MRARRSVVLAALATAAPIATAEAAPPELRYDAAIDLGVTLGMGVASLGVELGRDALGPTTCRWCATNSVDTAARGALRWSDPATAATLSDVGLVVVTPALSLGALTLSAAADGRVGGAGVDVLVSVEAMAVALVLTQATKFTVARRRPYATELRAAPRRLDDELSFFSGHTAVATALATASGTVAALRGYRGAAWVFVAGGLPALFTGYLRVGADRHWLSDVVVGASVGVAAGVLVPILFHAPRAALAAHEPAGAVVVPLVGGTW